MRNPLPIPAAVGGQQGAAPLANEKLRLSDEVRKRYDVSFVYKVGFWGRKYFK